MSQINARPGLKIHQVLKRTGSGESTVPHQSVCPAPHQNHPAAVVGDVPDS
ncbi:hypothetical protein A2U01_0069353, partial [Trifolium medium]|nr:hypothetical protein [Trifolium medium]